MSSSPTGETTAFGEVDGNVFGQPNQGITGEFSQGFQQSGGTPLAGITPRPDGNMWFTDPGAEPELGFIGTGGPPAAIADPSIVGSHQEGGPQSCLAGTL